MYSLAPDSALGSDTFWTWMRVSGEIRTATSALEEAGAALVGLVDATDWQSEGFRALHELLERSRDAAGVEVGSLRVREWELVAGGGE